MAFDPALPQTNSPITSAELRNQFNGLKEQIDDRPDFGQLDDIINTQTAGLPSSVGTLSLTVSNPPTQAEVQSIVTKINELLDALKRI